LYSMTREEHINRLVDETMASLDGMGRAVPAPFLYTRLVGRMDSGRGSALYRFAAVISRPTVVLAAALLVLLINAFILAGLFKNQKSEQTDDAGTALAYEYTHTSSNTGFYANNPDHP
jgi:hypothetical protein